ncbi:right-handed parallel beta-helix repeat-containing protein, partial [Membranihabitans maritimus]|uniref:right-handed parallel beta-helix repeat-containing protein n=1 Tax=Membranihabitans maritimus TaxID=2904244 RepID=UPI001F205B9C
MNRFNPCKFGWWYWNVILIISAAPIIGISQNFPFELPELPEGKKIQIFYNVVVNDPLDPLTTSFIGQQDTVFYGNELFLLSDDPATMAADDITLTPASQFVCNSFDGIVYVDQSAGAGSNDGSSWGNAFLNLQDALLAKIICPENVDTILVAEGTYYPTDDGNRDSSFNIPDSVVVLGGFPSGGSTLAERNELCELYPTVLSGEIQGDNNNTNNSYHVVYTDHVSEATVVDGFVITLGYALTGSINARGGGWFNDGSGAGQSSNPTIRNCTFINNEAHYGGALYNEGGVGSSILNGAGGEASPVITNCRFENNFAATSGGAVYNSGYQGISSPVIINSTFIGNTTQDRGGAIMNYCISYNDIDSESSPVFNNCVFSGNSASLGGAVSNWSELGNNSSPAYALVRASFVNCVFSGNSAEFQGGALDSYCDHGTDSSLFVNCVISGNYAGNNGGAMHLFGDLSIPEIINSIFYNNSAGSGNPVFHNGSANPSIQNSLFDVDFVTVNHNMAVSDNGGNKFETEPLFAYAPAASAAPTAAGDFRLMSGSPAIDMGDNTANMETEDLDGLSRVYNGTIDVGAYEWREYCKQDTVYLDENGEGIADETELVGELPEFPGCVVDTVLEVPSVSCSDTAVLYHLFLIKDEMDTVLRCTDTIWVLDTISPVIAMEEVELMLDNECMATMPDLSSYASDNCGVENFIQDPAVDENLGLPGEIVMVTLTAIDSSGNETIETFDIEVQ